MAATARAVAVVVADGGPAIDGDDVPPSLIASVSTPSRGRAVHGRHSAGRGLTATLRRRDFRPW
jgi:hypothetical protein